MAVVDNPLEGTELDEANQGQNANQNQGLQSQEVQKTSNAGGAIGAGGSPSAQSTAAPSTAAPKQATLSKRAPTSSGSFTNIQKYMQANKPAEFGKQVAGKISGEAQAAAQQLGQAKSGFSKAIDEQRAGFVGGDQLQSSFQALRDLTGKGDIRTGFDDQKRIAETGVSQKYTGPQQFENQSDLAKKGKDLSTLAKQAATDAGQRSLLQRYYGSPKYTGGQQKLDNLLLSGEQTGAMSKARQQAAIFDPRLRKSSEAARADAQAATQFADTNRERALRLAQEAQAGELSELDELVGQRAEQYKADVEKYRRSGDMNKALQGYNFAELNDMLGGGIGKNKTFLDRYTTAQNQATIDRTNADPAQAALANYFNRLTGGEDVVSNIAEATPAAQDVQYGLKTGQIDSIQQQARDANAAYMQALRNQQAAHDRYYGQGGGIVGDSRSARGWQTQDQLNNAAAQVNAAESRLEQLRNSLTGDAGYGRVGSAGAKQIDVHRGKAKLDHRIAEGIYR